MDTRWGALLWKLSRQLLRETEAYAARLAAISSDIMDLDTYARATSRLAAARAMFENPDFFDRVTSRD